MELVKTRFCARSVFVSWMWLQLVCDITYFVFHGFVAIHLIDVLLCLEDKKMNSQQEIAF